MAVDEPWSQQARSNGPIEQHGRRRRWRCALLCAVLAAAAWACSDSEPPTTSPRSRRAPTCDPVDARVVFSLHGDYEETGDLAAVGEAGAISRITYDGRSFDPDFAPDGRRLVYAKSPDEVSDTVGVDALELHVRDLRSGQDRRLTDGGEDFEPAWSPTGEDIAFARGFGGWFRPGNQRSRIWVVASDGSGLRPFFDEHPPNEEDWSPTWSPDGDRLAFLRRTRYSRTGIWTARADGTGAKLVVDVGSAAHSVVWSPRQDRLLVDRYEDEVDAPLYLVDLTEERPRLEPLTQTGISPAWSQAGEAVYYYGIRPDPQRFRDVTLFRKELATGATAPVGKEPPGLGYVYRAYGVTTNPCAR